MAFGGPKSAAFSLLFLNLILFLIVSIVAGWAINYGIRNGTPGAENDISPPVRLFPIYYPIGNTATGFFVVFALIAGVVGAATSLAGLQNLSHGGLSNVSAAAASSLISWSLILLAMGLACKEISIGWRSASLRTLETLTIISSGTQLLCIAALHAVLTSTIRRPAHTTAVGGRV